MSDPGHIFVYGTLRADSDHPMARRLSLQARLVGKGVVPGRLYDMGWYPAAMFDESEKHGVVGHVFALKPGGRLLAELDDYESGDPNYVRETVEVSLDDGRKLRAWAYGVKQPPNTRIIPGGDFIVHRNAKTPRPVRPKSST